MAKDLRYYLKFDSNGRKVMKELGISAEELDNALAKVKKTTNTTKQSMLSLASTTVVFDGLQSAVNGLYGAMKGLTDAYTVQIEAERKLETVMRERMEATADDIQVIKDLASAQQELGVIGDEVQLAGAQQLATFLNQTSILQELIPAMNNLVAQQKGYSATGNDAVAVANLMGKAMQGQASALRRVGITFTEAQEAMLKNGTESERAAMLADIITQNVGNMNAELAKTPIGPIKQLENALGDVKESIGGFISKAMPIVQFGNQIVMAASNVMKLTTAVQGAVAAVAKLDIVGKAAIATEKIATAVRTAHVVATRALSQGMQRLGLSATAASAAISGLRIASGVGLAFTALTLIIDKFTTSTDKAAKSSANFRKAVDVRRDYYNFKEPKTDDPDSDIAELKARGLKAQKEANRLARGLKRNEYSKTLRRDSNKRVIGSDMREAYNAYLAQIEIVKQTEHALELAQKRKIAKEKAAADEIKKAQESSIVNTETERFDTSMGVENFTMLGQFTQKLKELNEARSTANQQELQEIERQIKEVKLLQRLFEKGLLGRDVENIDYQHRGNYAKIDLPSLPTQEDITPTVDLSNVTNYFKEELEELKRQAEETAQSMKDSLMNGWNGIKGIGRGIDGITESINGNGSAWERVTGVIDGTIAVVQGVQAALQMATMVSAAFTAAKKAEGAAAKESASSSFLDAIAKLFEAHAWMPFVGIGIAGAMVGAMLATMLSAPKFAKGGIAYGPTLGIFGEYAGAANNPEVVAPLDKLRSLIQPAEGIGGDVRFRIAGADLEGVLIRRTNFRNRI